LKNYYRAKLLKERESYKKVKEDSEKIGEKFLSLPVVKNAKSIMFYYPHKNEVDTLPIIQNLIGKKIILLPVVKGKDLYPVSIKDLSNLKDGYAGIKEPVGEPFNPKLIDIVVVPAVAFDKHGYRLGYGKGYYDRFLTKTDALKIGFAYDFQILDKIDSEQHDIPVDIIITPTKIIKKEER